MVFVGVGGYEHEEEDENITSTEEEEIPYKEEYAETISANLEQRKLRKLEEITHDNTLPCVMGPIDKEEQHTKMKIAQKTMKKWISYEKDNQHTEEAHDNHPFRPMVHVKSHQLERGTRIPTGRLKKLTPNRIVVTMNQQVDDVIDLDHDTAEIDLVKNLQIPKD